MSARAAKVTAPSVLAMKGQERIVCLTAYDRTMGQFADAASVDLVLVGDSMGNTVLGYGSTLPVTMDDTVHHVRAVAAGVQRALLVADLPFGSYNCGVDMAVDAAVACVKAGAEAVKLEGEYTDEIRAIVKAGIPVMGHVGFTPQSVHNFGGHKVQGKTNSEQILDAARRIAESGAFAIVLELMPASLAAQITKEIGVPTIGIGAGPSCDGEIQVWHDILGLSDRVYKHSRVFAQVGRLTRRGVGDYVKSVKSREFPNDENSF